MAIYPIFCSFFLGIIALTACGGSSKAESNNSNLAPIKVAIPAPTLPIAKSDIMVESTFPNDEQKNVDIDKSIVINFSKNVLAQDIAIVVNSTTSKEPIDGELSILGDKVSFLPKEHFRYDSEYIVSISAAVTASLSVENHNFSFKTIAAQPSTSFHPSLVQQGTTDFLLIPIESTVPEVLTKISFGIPFPKDFLTNIEQFRIIDDQGNELAIFAKEILPWRTHNQEDESIRSAIVQTEVLFEKDKYGKPISKKLTLEWGTPRQFISETLVPVKDTWVLVNDSHYTMQDNVFEPNVYAVFSAQWYGDSVIKTRTLPMGTHEDFSAYDTAFELFGNTAINYVDPRVIDDNLIPHRSSYAAWLFDRATTIYQLAFKTGEFKFLRAGHRAVQFYLNHINERGFFGLKQYDDMKYSYGESLVTNFILTGDSKIPNIITAMVPAWDSFNSDYNVTTNFWTERHAAFQLKGYTSAYELTGDLSFKEKAYSTFNNLLKMQNTPEPGVPLTGGLMHTSESHGEGGDQFIASPWMSAILVDAVERFYIQFQEPEAIGFILKLADFFKQEGIALYEWKGYHGKDSFYVPYYLAGSNLTLQQRGGDGGSDLEHGLDVSKIFSLAYYFSCLNDSCDASYLAPISKLYKTATVYTLPYWMRTAAPKIGKASYRLAPPRKFNWWFNTTSNMDFLLFNTSLTNTTPNLNIENLVEWPEFYYPGQEFEVRLKVKNIDAIAAKNIVVDNKILKSSVTELLTISDISDGGILNPEGVAWYIPELAGGAESIEMSFKVTVGQFPTIQSSTRPLAKIISRTHLRYCHYLDSADACNSWVNYWTQGSQTIESLVQWSSIAATPPDTPPTINIITPLDNDTVTGMTTILAEVSDEDDIAKVDFLLQGELISSLTAAPFEHIFNSDVLSGEPHTLTVKAWDSFGSLAVKSLTLTPGTPDIKKPEVSILSPTSNQEYCGATTIDYIARDNFSIQSCELLLAGANVVLPNCGQYTLFPAIALFSSKAYLALDELGSSVSSQDGVNLLGTPHNITSEQGVNELAYRFNGEDSNISFSRTSLNIDNDITVSFWMKPSRDEGVIVSQDWNYIGLEHGWAISLGANKHESNNALSLTWSSGDYKNNANNNNVVQTAANVVSLDVWQNVVIRKNANLVDIFLDGVLVMSKNIAFSEIAWPFNSARQLSIGKGVNHPDMYNRYFAGALDDLAIWNSALTNVQIEQLYRQDNTESVYKLEVLAKDNAGNVGRNHVEFSIRKCSNEP